MQSYLHHLLTDIKTAIENLPVTPEWYENPYPFPVEKYILQWEQTPFVPLSELFGIPKEALPPIEKWTEEQLEILVNALTGLWDAYGYYPDLSEGVSAKVKYRLFQNYWDYEVQYTPLSGGGGFDFCEVDPSTCPYGELCWCLEFEDEWERDNQEALAKKPDKSDELPF